ncbi:MAG: RluA family pseudouridine synthase [Sandaracinaceae bacterium]|jgi:23S rRNA pseudouridine1911/1915/1917 synthase|nr:RluA family pseudouridine synthase [Sandaracinaceae bacterium]MBK8410057.1 RluA family pseudouridine synthase [Sandaracinaceae bacterium]
MTQPPPVDPLDDADFTDEDDELIAPAPRTPTSVEPIRVVLREQEAGERLDRVLAEREEIGHSRAVLQRWIAEGRVTVDGKVIDRKAVATPLGVVVIEPAPPPPMVALPEDLPLHVLFEDEHLIVVNKAAGMVVHPAPGHSHGTLVNALLHHAALDPALREGQARPGIVHRLDKDTSGVLVAAKTPAAHEGLVKLFQAHTIERRYIAIAVGPHLRSQTFDTFHGRHPHDRKRFSSTVGKGKRAVTRAVVTERLHGGGLLALTLETGRTHQIRVHLADTGTPVLADPLYGKRSRDPRLTRAEDAVGRQALHAELLGFVHPITGAALRIEAPAPADFQAALDILRDA